MRCKWKKVCTLFVAVVILLHLFYLCCYNNMTESTEFVLEGNQATFIRKYFGVNVVNISKEKQIDRNASGFSISRVVSTCDGMVFPVHLARKRSWQVVGSSRTAYVFAAYYVEITHTVIIIGIKSGGPLGYICQLWFKRGGNGSMTMEEKPAEMLSMPEGHGLKYSGVFFQCSLPSLAEIPTHASIVTKTCDIPRSVFQVHQLSKQTTTKRNFTVCLTPLNFRYDRMYELIEWVELNKILGAEKFTIYNYSSGQNVSRVLDYYSKRGLTEIVQWNIPVGVDTWPRENKEVEIHYFGQVVALNDCLYRNKHISEFIVNLDLDEFIIPHSENTRTWTEMLTELKENAQAYVFRNTFFKKEWDNSQINISNKSVVDKLKLVTLQKIQHERKIYPSGHRSKYFAKTNDAAQLMIHEVPRVKYIKVPIEIGLLHHYRNWETVGDPPHVKVVDNTVPNKFGKLLIKNVQQVWSDLGI